MHIYIHATAKPILSCRRFLITSFKKENKVPKKLHKVLNILKYILCFKMVKKVYKKLHITFLVNLFLFFNDDIRNILHDNISFVT